VSFRKIHAVEKRSGREIRGVVENAMRNFDEAGIEAPKRFYVIKWLAWRMHQNLFWLVTFFSFRATKNRGLSDMTGSRLVLHSIIIGFH